jgi:hypothetical protein
MANVTGVARRLVARAWEGAVCWRCLEPARWAVVLVGLEGERVEYGHCADHLPTDLLSPAYAIALQELQDEGLMPEQAPRLIALLGGRESTGEVANG